MTVPVPGRNKARQVFDHHGAASENRALAAECAAGRDDWKACGFCSECASQPALYRDAIFRLDTEC